MDLILIRVVFVLILAIASYFLRPFGLSRELAALAGAMAAGAVIVFELRVRALSLKRLFGAVIGSVLGIFGAFLFSLVLHNSVPWSNTLSLVQIFVLLLMSYVGLVVGTSKGDLLNLAALGDLFTGERTGKRSLKILDTSAIIDGRIADISDTGFPGRDAGDSGVCAARVAAGGGLSGRVEAAARAARAGYPAAHAEQSAAHDSDCRG